MVGPLVVHYWAGLQSVHGFRCCDNIHVCKLIASSTANAYSAECEMSASACTRSVAHTEYINVTLPFFMHAHCMYSKITGAAGLITAIFVFCLYHMMWYILQCCRNEGQTMCLEIPLGTLLSSRSQYISDIFFHKSQVMQMWFGCLFLFVPMLLHCSLVVSRIIFVL